MVRSASIRIAALVSISLLAAGLGGCTSSKDSVLPQGGPTMLEIYEQHGADLGRDGAGGARAQVRGRVGSEDADLYGYTRDAGSEIEQLFPRLPNPTLVMYVFPHLGEEGAPVPGYSTAVPMYERTEYALPGEIVP